MRPTTVTFTPRPFIFRPFLGSSYLHGNNIKTRLGRTFSILRRQRKFSFFFLVFFFTDKHNITRLLSSYSSSRSTVGKNDVRCAHKTYGYTFHVYCYIEYIFYCKARRDKKYRGEEGKFFILFRRVFFFQNILFVASSFACSILCGSKCRIKKLYTGI